MRRTAEDRPGAVLDQHEIGDIDRQRLAGDERVLRPQPGVEAELLRLLDRRFTGPKMVALLDERRQSGIVGCELGRKLVVGGDGAEAGAEDRVGPRREHLQPVLPPLDLEQEAKTLRPADPILLHQLDLGRPPRQPVERRQQLV